MFCPSKASFIKHGYIERKKSRIYTVSSNNSNNNNNNNNNNSNNNASLHMVEK